MISGLGIRNRELLLLKFVEPRKLRDAVNIVGGAPIISWEIREYVRNEFSPNNAYYRREMSRFFDTLSVEEERALIDLSREILIEESGNDNPHRSVLHEYIPNP